MKQGKLTAVVAVRKGSQRIPDKNIIPFGDSNLLEMKLNLLKKVKAIDEIIVNSDCDDMLAIGEKYGCLTHKREDHYASSIVNNSDFHEHIAKVTDTDFIFLAPTCSPFVTVESHNSAIKHFLNNPGFYKLNHFESVDVDIPFDFFIAEQIYNKFYKK